MQGLGFRGFDFRGLHSLNIMRRLGVEEPSMVSRLLGSGAPEPPEMNSKP